ncbi:MAG: hypothetical protein K2M30_02945, partial [Desulfovibrionaceae bacterium]|nr:hypothetical protein [Desulfovibrionaceae bacterium]
MSTRYKELEGKLFRVYCSGNSELYASYTSVKNSCLEKTAKFIYKQGYEYFTMLAHDEDTQVYDNGYSVYQGYSTHNITQNRVAVHTQAYIIRCITKKELKNFSNYYRVSD